MRAVDVHDQGEPAQPAGRVMLLLPMEDEGVVGSALWARWPRPCRTLSLSVHHSPSRLHNLPSLLLCIGVWHHEEQACHDDTAVMRRGVDSAACLMLHLGIAVPVVSNGVASVDRIDRWRSNGMTAQDRFSLGGKLA